MFPEVCEGQNCTQKKHSVDQIFYEANISELFEILSKSSPMSLSFNLGSRCSFKLSQTFFGKVQKKNFFFFLARHHTRAILYKRYHVKYEKIIGSIGQQMKSPSMKNQQRFIKLLNEKELACGNKIVESAFFCYSWSFLFVSRQQSKLHGNEKQYHSMEDMEVEGPPKEPKKV